MQYIFTSASTAYEATPILSSSQYLKVIGQDQGLNLTNQNGDFKLTEYESFIAWPLRCFI